MNSQPFRLNLAKWLSVHLQTKWLWVRIMLLSLKLQIWCLLQARSSLTFRRTLECRFSLEFVCDIIITYNSFSGFTCSLILISLTISPLQCSRYFFLSHLSSLIVLDFVLSILPVFFVYFTLIFCLINFFHADVLSVSGAFIFTAVSLLIELTQL